MTKQTILIIEDNPYISMLLKQLFSNDYHIQLEENGYDALEFLEEGNIPDLIISDLTMPKMDGHDFLKIIKTSSFFNEIPLLVLSGENKSQNRIDCLKNGADDYMIKPFNPEELELRVAKLFNNNKTYN